MNEIVKRSLDDVRVPAEAQPVGDVSPAGGLTRSMPWILQYWRMVVRWKWVIVITTVSALIVGLGITLLTTPKYTAVATLEISRQQERIVNVNGLEPESNFADQEFYQTQYSLLRSRTLAEGVAKDLNLATDQHYLQTFRIGAGGGLFGNRTQNLSPAERAKRERLVVDVLLTNVGVAPVRGSRLVSVSFTSPDPQISSKIVNAWTAHFIEANLARRFDATAYARKYLEQRLEQLKGRLEESERALVGYAAAQRIINVGSSESSDPDAPRVERPLAADDLVTLNRALSVAIADRIAAETKLRATSPNDSTESLTNQALATLRQRRAEVAADYAKMMVRFEPDYPAAKELQSQLQALDRSIAREEGRVGGNLRSDYESAAAREKTLKAQVELLKGNLLDQRRRSIQYNIFQRDVDTNRQLYDALLQRYKEIGVAGGVGTNNVAIVDSAQTPETPSSPRMSINLLIALLAGLATSTVLVLALEQIDEKIKDPTDVSRALSLPLLGTVPRSEGDPISDLLDRKSAISEAYLSIQAVLSVSTSHGMPRSISVSSTRASEGKSTTSVALALTLARTQRKVILIDCDMRSPSIHHLTGLSNTQGLSNILAGQNEVSGAIQMWEAAGLRVMTAGTPPPNAAELLTGGRLKDLVDRLLKDFDHVVLDGPPVLGIADAPLIGTSVDAVVCAVEANGARASVVRTAMQRLLTAHANVLGVILTKFDAKRAHYGYGYEYGYGYGRSDRESA